MAPQTDTMKYKGNREILFGKKGEGKRFRGEGQKEREEIVHVQGLVVVPSCMWQAMAVCRAAGCFQFDFLKVPGVHYITLLACHSSTFLASPARLCSIHLQSHTRPTPRFGLRMQKEDCDLLALIKLQLCPFS